MKWPIAGPPRIPGQEAGPTKCRTQEDEVPASRRNGNADEQLLEPPVDAVHPLGCKALRTKLDVLLQENCKDAVFSAWIHMVYRRWAPGQHQQMQAAHDGGSAGIRIQILTKDTIRCLT